MTEIEESGTTTVARETGSETTPCPTCERPLAVQQNQDGSSSPVRCDNCYPVDIVEMASEEAAPQAEHGTYDAVSNYNPEESNDEKDHSTD